MHIHILTIGLILLFSACSVKTESIQLAVKPLTMGENEKVLLDEISIKEMITVHDMLKESCSKKRFSSKYTDTCKNIENYKDSEEFFKNAFEVREIITDSDEKLMTGYYEATLYGSKHKSEKYQFPIYVTPPNMKKLYFERKKINTGINVDTLCYVDSLLDRFFLHVQGSGRVVLDDGSMMFIGYAAQNGHAYTSIGKEMIKRGYIAKEDISLQSIRFYFEQNPFQLQKILELNKSYVFFAETNHSAMGALGVELTPMHSVATDLSYIPLGTPLIYKANNMTHLALSQDTGGAIKGEVRADLFFGYGVEAKQKAGKMNHNLDLWVLVPKVKKSQQP